MSKVPGREVQPEAARIRAAYERRDSEPPSIYGWDSPGYQFYIQQLEWNLVDTLRRLGVRFVGAEVLEVGCGSGYFLQRFLDFGAKRSVGIDLVESRIEAGSARYPNLELLVGDASALHWEEGSFDLVTHFTCLSSVLDPEVRAAIAHEMWRVLRPGGALVSYDMRPTPLVFRALARLRDGGFGMQPSEATATPTRPVTVSELQSWFPTEAASQRAVTLHLDLAAVARRGRLAASLLELVPFLRTHTLAVFIKPGID